MPLKYCCKVFRIIVASSKATNLPQPWMCEYETLTITMFLTLIIIQIISDQIRLI